MVESYEEANNSAGTPNAIPVGQEGEWDWVVQDNGAAASTTYYFRMVKATGTVLGGYTNYPQPTTAIPVLTQDHYRWYDNVDAIQPTTSLGAEDTAITNVAVSAILRLRASLQGSSYPTATGQTFRLQYSTSTGGPWTDVGGLASGEVWRGYDNPTPADGASLSSVLLALSDSSRAQTYEEANDSAPTPNIIETGKRSEWAWVLQPNDTLGNTTYYFRMVRGNGTPLEVYTSYPTVTMGNTTPNAPTSLGPAQYVDNAVGWGNDNTPALTFTISDPDSEQQVEYQIQIASDSGFASVVVDYTSGLQAQTSTSAYMVGQSGGTYTTGSQGMTLSDTGTGYWWRVKTIDELTSQSGWYGGPPRGYRSSRSGHSPGWSIPLP